MLSHAHRGDPVGREPGLSLAAAHRNRDLESRLLMSQPIRIHPQNPKLFEFRGQPLVLVTATEHYGAVMNRTFRFERYLADAADKKMTLTRCFMLFREMQTSINPYSTCKP